MEVVERTKAVDAAVEKAMAVPQGIDITKLSTVELKAIAYDNIAELERIQNNLRVINQEIAKRMQEQASTPTGA